jgi:hypothetical protein
VRSRHQSRAGTRLARVAHQVFIAAADPDMSPALRSVGLLDWRSSTPVEPLGRVLWIRAHLLAKKPGEKRALKSRCGALLTMGCRNQFIKAYQPLPDQSCQTLEKDQTTGWILVKDLGQLRAWDFCDPHKGKTFS